MAISPAIPRPTVPFLDQGRNQVSREWYLFLANLFATQNVVTGLTGDEVFIDESTTDLVEVDTSLTPTLLAWMELEQDVSKDFSTVPWVLSNATPDRLIVGQCQEITAGITIPSAVFRRGDMFWVANSTAGALTLTQGGGLTLRLAGTATTGNRTIAQEGLVTIAWRSDTEAWATGNVT